MVYLKSSWFKKKYLQFILYINIAYYSKFKFELFFNVFNNFIYIIFDSTVKLIIRIIIYFYANRDKNVNINQIHNNVDQN